MSNLLPASATSFERKLSSISERLLKLPVPMRALKDAQQCPVALLGYLAYESAIPLWSEQWSESVKRNTIKDALYQHRIRGSRQAVEDAVAHFGAVATIREWWEQTPKGEPHTFQVTVSSADNEQFLPVFEHTANVALFCAEPIRITHSRVYKMHVRVRQTVPSVVSRVSAGFVALDSKQNAIGSRYEAANAVELSKEDGWRAFVADFTGAGVELFQFPAGTMYIKPALQIENLGTVQVAEVSLIDQFENQQQISNFNFVEGKAGWSGSADAVTSPAGNISTVAFRPTGNFQDSIVEAINLAKPLRSTFDLTVGTHHSGFIELQPRLLIHTLHRGVWQ